MPKSKIQFLTHNNQCIKNGHGIVFEKVANIFAKMAKWPICLTRNVQNRQHMYLAKYVVKIANIFAKNVVKIAKNGSRPGVIAEPLAVGGASREEDVVHGDHGHVLLCRRVAAVRQSCEYSCTHLAWTAHKTQL
jgi:hypothetical protein